MSQSRDQQPATEQGDERHAQRRKDDAGKVACADEPNGSRNGERSPNDGYKNVSGQDARGHPIARQPARFTNGREHEDGHPEVKDGHDAAPEWPRFGRGQCFLQLQERDAVGGREAGRGAKRRNSLGLHPLDGTQAEPGCDGELLLGPTPLNSGLADGSRGQFHFMVHGGLRCDRRPEHRMECSLAIRQQPATA